MVDSIRKTISIGVIKAPKRLRAVARRDDQSPQKQKETDGDESRDTAEDTGADEGSRQQENDNGQPDKHSDRQASRPKTTGRRINVRV